MFRGHNHFWHLLNQNWFNERQPLVIVESVWDNITNKPIIAECAPEEDWSGLVVGIMDELTMKVVPVKPDEEYYSRWSLLIKALVFALLIRENG